MINKNIVIGVLAHVDSGKTTLVEGMLYTSGNIRKIGRVDYKNTFLDNFEIERKRGITVFSKQAKLNIGDKNITILDTPGHVDFSSEMERTLQVIDYAILLINGKDGVQGHTYTLWNLLKKYNIPTFIFVNKMDQPGTDKFEILSKIQEKLDDKCIDFSCDNGENFFESIAFCDEELMEKYLSEDSLTQENIAEKIIERRIFPCFFGSALKLEGIDYFLESLDKYIKVKTYQEEFGAKIYKITYDEKNTRLTHMKITGGCLRVKDSLSGISRMKYDSEKTWNEKIDQIRIYSGAQFTTVNEIYPGQICAVTGLSKTYSGQAVGNEQESELPILNPVLTYKIDFPEGYNAKDMYLKLVVLEEEDPLLHIGWNSELEEIQIQVMGDIQIEVLKNRISERFGVDVEFGKGNIIYRETIRDKVIGIGHFEPLRHYAEVQVLMEPLERGKGLEFASICSEDMLDKNWQRLIMTHFEEKKHRGVLCNHEITDMRITLIGGRAHLKHTEGGDFRQATYRAIRQGLKSAESVLLEPVYEFHIEVPHDMVGRAMADIQRRNGSFEAPVIEGDNSIITGTAPVSTMLDYPREVTAYTHGLGKMHCILKGYDICHNQQEVIEHIGYDSENDMENPTGSVFCSHGAGYYVKWQEVPEYAHIKLNHEGILDVKEEKVSDDMVNRRKTVYSDDFISEEEIDEIFSKTFGNLNKERNSWGKTIKASQPAKNISYDKMMVKKSKEEYMLIDGYNIIFAWEELNELSKINIDSARDKLIDIMSNYQGYKNNNVIIVFDAYKVPGKDREILKYHNINVVYTKEAETADQYIEKVTHKIGQKYNVTVATSDRLEQMIVWGEGAIILSANSLKQEVDKIEQEIREVSLYKEGNMKKEYLLDNLCDEVKEQLELSCKNLIDEQTLCDTL